MGMRVQGSDPLMRCAMGACNCVGGHGCQPHSPLLVRDLLHALAHVRRVQWGEPKGKQKPHAGAEGGLMHVTAAGILRVRARFQLVGEGQAKRVARHALCLAYCVVGCRGEGPCMHMHARACVRCMHPIAWRGCANCAPALLQGAV